MSIHYKCNFKLYSKAKKRGTFLGCRRSWSCCHGCPQPGADRTETTCRSNLCCGSGSGIWCLFDPWIQDPGWVKKSGSGSVMINPDHIYESLKNNFFLVKILKFFDADPGIREGKNSDLVSGINIPDPQHWRKHNNLTVSVFDPDPVGSGSTVRFSGPGPGSGSEPGPDHFGHKLLLFVIL